LTHIHTPTPPPYPLSLHDALPISLFGRPNLQTMPSLLGPLMTGVQKHTNAHQNSPLFSMPQRSRRFGTTESRAQDLSTEVTSSRSEEHTSELQSRSDLVCRLLLEK